jgi:hypothetical protein
MIVDKACWEQRMNNNANVTGLAPAQEIDK